ncbi:FecR family protein [Echinicola vietnamensis]|uniref:Fe2+-dicitrate sensor, membrane component n=1 Tax=Echinicola vietnamensis (strain DSM 17526 / LMG 23754 / KMM 6221) TaxID=926556 RepID=L0G616_ECHVK|nr:FecR domain-containing protein [Echinicola vietnamensis]AGA80738.1 Fe2+-dicitrate sensor, membrane component [Echinicola vietnamensis DSM 17526]
MHKEDFRKLLQRQHEGKTSRAEDRLIARIWEQVYAGHASFNWEEVPEDAVKNSIREKVRAQTSVAGAISNSYWLQLVKVAAVIVLLLTGGITLWHLSSSPATEVKLMVKSTDPTQRAKITLPDGSMVHLNVNSTLTYPEEFEDGLRRVSLEGEAFFEVQRDTDRPFLVSSAGLETKVLGTSFNVNAYKGKEEMVTVKSGKVQVSPHQRPEKRVLLLPDEAAVLDGPTAALLKQPYDADKIIGWKSGRLAFDMVPFDEVVATLERYYHTPITLKNYQEGSCMIKASYQNNGLQFILSGLQLLVDFEYEKQADGSMAISYKSCRKS